MQLDHGRPDQPEHGFEVVAVEAGGGEFGGGGRADGQGMVGQRDRGAVFRETDRVGVFPLNESNWF